MEAVSFRKCHKHVKEFEDKEVGTAYDKTVMVAGLRGLTPASVARQVVLKGAGDSAIGRDSVRMAVACLSTVGMAVLLRCVPYLHYSHLDAV
jgi:hypothetical protein